ncbi:anti-sigma-D factor RsdA [Pseudonocardia nigra]|uniref:anti-sigma-D factor RsdA n=1 Tax=Pseudonocardia nigra TaxID=1921578 RepID=UPI001C5CE7B0|nr:anti-sigma-D factor RsdA [Pseudonocardia nigra]
MRDNGHGSGVNPFGPGHHGGNGTNGTNGSRPGHMHTRPVRFDEIEEPVDLVAVQADDELINALAAGMSVSAPGVSGYDADDRVAAILASWKAEVDADPIPELVDLDTAVATVTAAQPRRRGRYLAPVAAAAAFLVLAIGGVSVSSYNAEPDDVLWGVTKVLYSERAESVEAAVRVETHIAKAKEALVAGQPVLAAQELQQAEVSLETVRPEEGRVELAEVQEFLAAKAAETPPGQPANPSAPLASDPSRRVPPGAATGQPADTTQQPVPPTNSPVTGTPAPVVPASPAPSDSGAGSATPSPSPEVDVRSGPADDPSSPAQGNPEPSTQPTPSPNDEGGPATSDGGSSPSATPEGTPDETTTTPGQSTGAAPGGGGAAPSSAPTASGSSSATPS